MKSKSETENIDKTIAMYQKNLMCDINLTLRLSDYDHTYITKPTEWTNREIVFESPIQQLDWVIFTTNDILEMVLISKFGLFHSRIKILRKYKSGDNLFYVGEIVSSLIKKQQREYFRLDTIFDIKYQLVSNYIPKSDNLCTSPYEKGICVNLSTGGMCFNSINQIDLYQFICVTFQFADLDFVLYAKVLEIGEKNHADYYPHRIQFVDMDTITVNSLTKSIFDKQRNMLKPLR